MLYHLRTTTDPLIDHVKNDPVRPHIPVEQRVNDRSEILMLREAEQVLAVTCMTWTDQVPADEEDLTPQPQDATTAVFYTIWSYAPGAGARLLREAADWLVKDYPNLKNIVTLSPQTEMARRFHLKNGARVRRENTTSVNYEYYAKE